MTTRQIAITIVVLGLVAAALSWGLYGFVIGTLGSTGCQSGYCEPHPRPHGDHP